MGNYLDLLIQLQRGFMVSLCCRRRYFKHLKFHVFEKNTCWSWLLRLIQLQVYMLIELVPGGHLYQLLCDKPQAQCG